MKMKNRIISLLLCAFILVGFTPLVLSAEDAAATPERLIDGAGLLSAGEASALLARLDEVSARQGSDIVIVTVAGIDDDRTPTQFADDTYDYGGYGVGTDKSGILFLISMAESDWAISTCGYCITAFTDAGQEYLFDQIRSDLSDGNYAAAFNGFVDQCDAFLTQAKTGEPYDSYNLPKDASEFGWAFFFCLIFGVLIALLITGRMASKLKTVRSAAAAEDYTVKDSLNVKNSSDIYIRTVVSKIAKQTDNGSSGGSTTHTSSSGQTHGGSSGKF